MTILHSGSNNQYSSNWEKAFKKGTSQKGSTQKGKAAAPARATTVKVAKKLSKKK